MYYQQFFTYPIFLEGHLDVMRIQRYHRDIRKESMMSAKKLPNCLTVKEAAELLHVSIRTIHRYIQERFITAVRLKRR